MEAIWNRSAFAIVLAAAAIAAPAQAQLVNAYRIQVRVDGNTVTSIPGGGGSAPATASTTQTYGSATAKFAADVNQYTSAHAELSGSGNVDARVQSSSSFSFNLQPPPGVATVKGGKLILHVVLDGTATGNAELRATTDVKADFGNGTGTAAIGDATTKRTEYDVVTTIAPFIQDLAKAGGKVRMSVDARVTLSGSGTAVADATNATRVTGFRVVDVDDAQVKGFTMVAAGGNIPEIAGNPPVIGSKVQAIEFYHAAFKHYFVSANPSEIAKLDDGTFSGWTRTGQSFYVYTMGSPTGVPVCRFFTVAFPPTSSHFYAPRGLGCEGTMTNDKWEYEGDVFKVPLPDGAGQCPAGSIPVYRLYNNGQGGAPNHRFTTSDATRQQMLAQGFIAEGAGIGVGFCSPQ